MEGKERNPYKNGYVVIGYPGDSTMKSLIRQWRACEDVSVCVVDEELEEKPRALDFFRKTHFISGSLLKNKRILRLI